MILEQLLMDQNRHLTVSIVVYQPTHPCKAKLLFRQDHSKNSR